MKKPEALPTGNDPALAAALEVMEELYLRHRFRKFEFFEPYDKQKRFFELGLTFRERLLTAGNQLGKTEAGAYECAMHLTGLYPDWWTGRRYDHPVNCWAAGETGLLVRDGPQTKLFGSPGVEDDFGTGLVPKETIIDKSLSRGVTDAYDTVQVRHITGNVSKVTFKSYEQGREKFQTATLDFVWCDEEPPEDIYGECLARITATKGMVYTTFTPLKGWSDVVNRFLKEVSPDRQSVTMVIEDAKHIPPEERAKIIAGYKPHERDARTRGIPMLGSGRIFPYSTESISEPMMHYDMVPLHWLKFWGIDFGIAHPFAAVLMSWDRDNDVIHIHACIRISDQQPLQHVVPMKRIGASVPVSWPQDGTQRQVDAIPLAMHYKHAGLLMMAKHATHPDGSISTEAGVMEMDERMTTGRLKVAAHLSDWFEEFGLYHRDNGMIVKVRDDLLSATRVGIMMKRYGKAVPFGHRTPPKRRNPIAEGTDFDVFG